MSKPTSLTEAEIADIEMRLRKGWAVRAFEYEPLIAMAREFNAAKTGAAPAAAGTPGPMNWTNGGWSPATPLQNLCGND